MQTIAGPQLVCPVDNARFALNAANARWGSLLDALYGTDVIPGEREGPYSAERGALVFERAEAFLDESFGLERPRFSVTRARFSDVQRYSVVEKGGSKQLVCVLADGTELGLAKPSQFVGYTLRGDPSSGQQQQGGGGGGAAGGELASVLLCHHDLHCEIRIDPDDPIGRTHPAGVKDIVLESAITTIMDFEDSVSAVDAVDKARCYANWAGLVRGDLSTTVAKGGQTITRSLRPDLSFRSAHGGAATLTLPGRSLLLVRNVGIHMYTDAVTTADGAPIPEGFLDALTTVMAAIPDIRRTNSLSNSRSGRCGLELVQRRSARRLADGTTGQLASRAQLSLRWGWCGSCVPAGLPLSVYVVKPKMHGPEEVAFVCEVFAGVEAALGLEPNTVKLVGEHGARALHKPTRSLASLGSARLRAPCSGRWLLLRASWTRSGALPPTWWSASAPPRSGWCSSTPASWTAPAMRSTHPWRPARCCQRQRSRERRGCAAGLGALLVFRSRDRCEEAASGCAAADAPVSPAAALRTRTGTSTPASRRACAAWGRSARECGRRRTRWPRCWPRRGGIRAPEPRRRGCPAPPRPRCTRSTTTR